MKAHKTVVRAQGPLTEIASGFTRDKDQLKAMVGRKIHARKNDGINVAEQTDKFDIMNPTIASLTMRRPNYKEVVILHVFSGPRRNGDIHCQLVWREQIKKFNILVISLDICLSKDWGDVLERKK